MSDKIKIKGERIDAYVELANKILPTLTIEVKEGKKGGKEGFISEEDKSKAYYENLPEGMTKKEVEAVNKYNAAFSAATYVASAQKAIDAFKADKDLGKVKAKVHMGSNADYTKTSFNREYDSQLSDKLTYCQGIMSRGVGVPAIDALRKACSEAARDVLAK